MAEQSSGEEHEEEENAADGGPPKEDDVWTPLVRKRTIRKKKPRPADTDVTEGPDE